MTGPIVFDGSILRQQPYTGVARSFLTSLKAYAQAYAAEQQLLLLLPMGSKDPNIEGVKCSSGPASAWQRQSHLPGLLQRLDAQLLHSPVTALPHKAPCPMLATVHDLPWLQPELRREPGSRWRHRLALKLAARRAQAIIVPSQATALDLQQCQGRNISERMHVLPHGVDLPDTTTDLAQLKGDFLILGDCRPRKNHLRIRRAHALARSRCQDLPALRMVGPPWAYVDEETKHALLRSCRALLHLSLWEGFGLPVLEAMAHGVPVLCSDSKSLPELVGGAALQVSAYDEDAMAQAMLRMHQDKKLRQRLAREGRTRAMEFSPQRVAEGWRGIHQQLIREAHH